MPELRLAAGNPVNPDTERNALLGAGLGDATPALLTLHERSLALPAHGDMPRWQAALAALPPLGDTQIALDEDAVRIGAAGAEDSATRECIASALQALRPWRKGPFSIGGVTIDSEWRSDLKWRRVRSHIAPLAGRRVLDVGCGNGYYMWRMLGAGARFVLGVDPTQLFRAQFAAIGRYVPGASLVLLPVRAEDLPPGLGCFDTVFSMGVIYHRRAPLEHLRELHGALRPGGELVLETLVIPAREGALLVPGERYAKMRNVWCIPSVVTALDWLHQAGFENPRVVDESRTTTAEQRATEWMRFESLADFLDPADPSRTVEGYPAPCRAVLIANRAPAGS